MQGRVEYNVSDRLGGIFRPRRSGNGARRIALRTADVDADGSNARNCAACCLVLLIGPPSRR